MIYRKPMKLVLFGAGASIDASLGKSPPLMKTLLAELIFAFNSWAKITGKALNLLERNFEKGWEYVLAPPTNLENPQILFPFSPKQQLLCDLQWDLAEFFFRFVLKNNSLYEELLIRSFDSDEVVEYSTLNYDTLLIQAVNRVSARNPGTQCSVSFPHGCAAFFCEACLDSNGRITAPKGRSVEFNPTIYGLQSNGPVRLIKGLREFWDLKQQGSVFPPIICHINPSKYVTSGANFIVEQQKKMEYQIRNADQIVVIGMRVNENDRHIWEPLRNAKGDILYISGSEEALKFQDWTRRHRRKGDQALRRFWGAARNQVYDVLSV